MICHDTKTVVCGFLELKDLPHTGAVNKEFKFIISDKTTKRWCGRDSSREDVIKSVLTDYLSTHYDIDSSHGTKLNMRIKTFENIRELDIVERILIRNIVRRHIQPTDLISVLARNDEPEEQFALLHRLAIDTSSDVHTDLDLLIKISKYAENIRQRAVLLLRAAPLSVPSEVYHELMQPCFDYESFISNSQV